MTSNLGSQLIQEMTESQMPEMSADENYYAIKHAILEIVGQHFRPEFINRIDDIVVFHPLSETHIRAIANLQIDYLRQRLQLQNLGLCVTEAALDKIGEAGYDPVYGARPLKRAIQQGIENPLAQEILAGQFISGDTIEVDWRQGAMQFSKLIV